MCEWPHKTLGRPSSFTNWIIIIIIVIICDRYFFLVCRDKENIDTFLACLRLGSVNEVEASRSLRRFFQCNIWFQMMLSESVSRLYFSDGITCEPIPSVQRNFLKETRFYSQCKMTFRNQTAKKAS